jgi:hypothetical protein
MSTALLATLKAVFEDGSSPIRSSPSVQQLDLAQYSAGHIYVECVNEDGSAHSLVYDTLLLGVRRYPTDAAAAISLQATILDTDPDGNAADNWARFELIPGHWTSAPPNMYGYQVVALVAGDPDDMLAVVPHSPWKTTAADVHPGDSISVPESQQPLAQGPAGPQGPQGPAGTAGTAVTSVGLALPAEFTISGSPVTTTGTLTGVWADQLSKQFLGSPLSSTGTPQFRVLHSGDIPQDMTLGDAGGDVTGQRNLATVVGLWGTAIADLTFFEGTPPNNGDALIWSAGDSQWEPTAVVQSASGGTGITAGGTAANRTFSLANTAVSPSSYGDASHVGTFTVDQQGRLTAAGSTSIAIAESQVTGLTTDLAALLPLAGGTMTGAITLSGTQLGTYTLGGTPTLGAALGIGTDNTYAIGDTTHRLSGLFTEAIGSGDHTLTITADVADGASAKGVVINASVSMSTTGARPLEIQNAGTAKGAFGWSTVGFSWLIADGGGFFGTSGGSGMRVTSSAQLDWYTSSSLRMELSTAAFYPTTTFGLTLGKSGNFWSQVMARQYVGVEQTIAAAATITLDPASGQTIRVTLSGTAITTVNAGTGAANQEMIVEIIQDGTGGRSISGWSASFVFAGGSYTPTSTASKRDILTFTWDSVASKWYEQSRSMNL